MEDWKGELLDDSEMELIFRTIVSAGKEPSDAATVEEYMEAYIGVRCALRFAALKPETLGQPN